ncbi:MAG: SdpI family protein [Culicoidibacterales bacterium]
MKKMNWQEGIILILAIAPLIFVISLYQQLPLEIPIHWNMNGEIDGYGPRWMQLMFAGIGLGVYGLMFVVPKIDPKGSNIAKFATKYQALRLAMQVFFAALIVLTTFVSLGVALDVDMMIRAGVSLLLVFIGNYLGKMKQNYTIGIKTPWTLANTEVWNRTHRMAGHLWVGLGTIMFVSAFFSGALSSTIFVSCIFIMVIVPMIYSYVLYKKLPSDNE